MKLRKYSRLFIRFLGILSIFFIALFLAAFFLVKSHHFQTWLGKKVSEKLSNDTGIDLEINRIEIDFFKTVVLKEVFAGKKYTDTLLAAKKIKAEADIIDRDKKEIKLKSILLDSPKFILHQPEKGKNLLDSLLSYFDSGPDTTSSEQAWKFDPGTIELKNGYVRISSHTADTLKEGLFHPALMTFGNINAQIKNLAFDSGNVRLKAEKLSAFTNFGIHIQKLSCDFFFSDKRMSFHNTELHTSRSKLITELNFSYDSLECFSDFINSVRITASIFKGSKFHPADLMGFAPDFKCVEDTITFSGDVDGTISDLHAQNLYLKIKEKNILKGDVSILGLPGFSKSFIHARIKTLYVDWTTLNGMKIPSFCDNQKLDIPQEILRSSFFEFRGEIDGTPEDIILFGKARTGAGNLKMDLEWKKNKPFEWEYNGSLQTEYFEIGKILNNKEYQNTSFELKVKGKGITIDKIVLESEGKINYLDFHGYRYHHIAMNGTLKNREFKGKLEIKDTSLDMSFDGVALFEKKDYHFDFIAEIRKFHPENLHFFSLKEKGYFSSQVLIQLKGNDINNMSGIVHFDDTKFTTAQKMYKISTFYLELQQNQLPKKITLHSDFLSALAEGNFRLSHIHEPMVDVLNHYYPTFFKIKTEQPEKFNHEYIQIKLKIKKFNFIHDLFYDKLDVANNTLLNLKANRKDHNVKIDFLSDSIKFSFLKLKNISFSVNEEDVINLKLKLNEIYISDTIDIKNLEFCVNSRDKLSTFDIDWRGDTADFKNHGEIEGKILFNNESFYLILDSAYVDVHDSIWSLHQSGIIAWNKDRSLLVSPILIYHNQQQFSMEGFMSPRTEEEKINIVLQNINLETFKPILSGFGIYAQGILNGCISLSHVRERLFSSADLTIDRFVFNDNHFGKLYVESTYHHENKSITLNGYTDLGLPDVINFNNKNIRFGGTIYPFDKENNFDLSFSLMPLNPTIINPFVKDIFNIKKGYITGNLKLTGKFSDPQLNGELMLKNTVLIPDFTKVAYVLNGQIEVMPDQIRFSDIYMHDQVDSKKKYNGVINGNIFHRKFKDWQLDFDITYRNMLVLNTTEKDNSLYYGKIFSSGNIGIWGFLDDLYMNVEDTIKGRSRFYLALDNPEEAGDFDFIHFRKKDSALRKQKSKDLSGFHLNMNITAKPDFSPQIIFDRTVGDVLNANGYAQLNMKINTLGKFEMSGDYQIESGDYTFSLEKFLSKKFELEQGSSILWSGDPINADIDITAFYKNRVSIAPLINDTTGQFKSRTPVFCKLKMTKKLLNPNISFEFDFPGVNDNVKSSIYNILSDENERNRQVFAFLMLRSFIPPLIYSTHSGGVTAGNAAASTGSEFLSAKMNSLFQSAMGNVLGDFDIGINYNPGSAVGSDEVLMNMNKNFLNNRLTFEGNFGVNNNRSSTGGSNFIGDVNIEYKLSPDGKYKVRGFNRTNDVTQLTVTGGLYTQGVGIGISESFETWNELFRKYLKKIGKKG
ncbi:MAG: translocation/assembly module TamB [Bacteroidia bacterium]|nr:translocation/assembly module TamB [Bacteroidia bacterium]